MSFTDFLVFFAVGGILLGLVFFVMVPNILDLKKAIDYVKMELNRASSSSEIRHWSHELTALRLCIIPGVTLERAKKIVAKFTKK